MSHDRWTRRTGAVLLCAAVLTVSHGCRRSPFQRLDGPPPAVAAPGGAERTPASPTSAPVGETASTWKVAPGPLSSPAPATAPAAASTVTFPLSPIPTDATTLVSAPRIPASPTAQMPDPIKRSVATAAPAMRDPAVMRTDAQVVKTTSSGTAAVPDRASSGVVLASSPTPAARPSPAASAIPKTRDDRKETTAPGEVTIQPKPAEAGADAATLKQAYSQAVGLLSLARARPADPIPLMVAAATLASSVTPAAKEVGAPSTGAPPAASSAGSTVEPAIKGLKLCRNVTGLGAYEPMEASRLKPGQPALLYCEPTGLTYEQRDGVFVYRLSSRVELVSVASGSRVWDLPLGEARDESPSRRHASYVNYRMSFPHSITPGEYLLRLTQTDLVANRTVSSELPVTFVR